MRRRNKKHYSIYIAWILLLLCVIGGLKAGIEESAVGKEQTHSEISIQSRWEELLKSVSEKKNDKKKDQKKIREYGGRDTEKYQDIAHDRWI